MCGDIHGQFHDLENLWAAGGLPSERQYLFLGDLVDRGQHGLEVTLTLLLHKLLRPSRMHVLRGNHESRCVSMTYGFYDECIRKYGTPAVWLQLMELFDLLPVAAVIDGRTFAVHGGLSPDLPTVDHIELLDRCAEIPQDGGPLTDLLWSDPADADEMPDHGPLWMQSPRGGGYLFGGRATRDFLHANGLQRVLRSHQLCMAGWRSYFDDRLLTVWSAPNYVYRCGNAATVCLLDDAAAEPRIVPFDKAERQEEEAQRSLTDYFM